MRVSHIGDDSFFRAAFPASSNHDRRAVRVVGTDIEAPMAAQFLKSHPDVRLDVFHQMADMDMSVGVRQRGGDKDLTRHFRTVPIDKKQNADYSGANWT